MIDLNDAPHPFPPQVRYDLDAIVAHLHTTANSSVPRHFPNGRRVGDEWRLANIRGDAPRKQGSCVIALKGEHAGDWHDFDGGQGGGPLSALEKSVGLTSRNLFAYTAECVGWSPGAPARREPAPAAVKPDTAREIAFIMERAVALADTPDGEPGLDAFAQRKDAGLSTWTRNKICRRRRSSGAWRSRRPSGSRRCRASASRP